MDDKVLRARIKLELAGNDSYRFVIENLRARRPQSPPWEPAGNNGEHLKFISAQQQYHDLLMALLDPGESNGR